MKLQCASELSGGLVQTWMFNPEFLTQRVRGGAQEFFISNQSQPPSHTTDWTLIPISLYLVTRKPILPVSLPPHPRWTILSLGPEDLGGFKSVSVQYPAAELSPQERCEDASNILFFS